MAQPLVLKARVSPKAQKPQTLPLEPTSISYLDLIRQAHEERLAREAQAPQFRAMNPEAARVSAHPTLIGWVHSWSTWPGR